MDTALKERIAANEGLFREINERIVSGQWPGEEHVPIAFRCECARLGCNDMIVLTPPEYERLRSHARRFLLIPGHELPEVETVVERAEDYVVVEKLGEAGAFAEATNPRD